MALELEQEIMDQIGLGANYQWFNGSGSCIYIRQEAAWMIGEKIQEAHDSGKPITQPNQKLVDILCQIAIHDAGDKYTLTYTWQAASAIIAEHIHNYSRTESDAREACDKLAEYLKKKYLRQTEREWITSDDMDCGNCAIDNSRLWVIE